MDPQLLSALPECALRPRACGGLPRGPRKAPPTTGGRGCGGRPYPVCPSSGLWRKAAPLRLSLATEGQPKHGVGTDSQGSLPSGPKLFAQLRRGALRARSLCAGLATPRLPWALLGGTSAARRPGPQPAHCSATRRLEVGGWIPGHDCAPLSRTSWRKSARRGVQSTALSSASRERESEGAAQIPAPSIRVCLGCAWFCALVEDHGLHLETATHSREAAPLRRLLSPA